MGSSAASRAVLASSLAQHQPAATAVCQELFPVPTSVPAHPAIDAAMASAASLLGMEVVFLGGLTDDTFTF